MLFQHVIWMDFQSATPWWHLLQEVLGAPWLQNLILAVTAAIGLWTLGASSSQERRRATVDILLQVLDDKDYLDARRKVRKLIEAGLDIPLLLSEEGIADRRQVLSILNRYEFMAAGLRERAFDTNIYQRMYQSNVLSDWNGLEAFIRALREDRNIQTLFQEYEQLILDWKKHPLKAYERSNPSKVIKHVVTRLQPVPSSSDKDNSSAPASQGLKPGESQLAEKNANPGTVTGAIAPAAPPEKHQV